MSLISVVSQPVSFETKSRSQRGRVLMLSTAIGVGGGAEEQVMLLSLGGR